MAMGQGSNKTHILSVTQLTQQIRSLLEDSFLDVWVEGEVSNLTAPQSGHVYLTLKDEQSQVRAVLFRSSQRNLKFLLQHGMRVICRGRISVYEPRGEYQLILEYVEPRGTGALQLAFEQLKARLEEEGLFSPDSKKPLPLFPRRIGVITSPSGAAVHDILRVIKRRHPRMHILIYPVPVQGAEAAPAIVEALRYFNRERNVDVIIAGRGGGSLEDLWAFNEESVARAIFESRLPVISAVGHETDYTIADFVSDLRAPTPSAAAEMVVETERSIRETVRMVEAELIRSMREALDDRRSSLREMMSVLGDPRRTLERHGQKIDDLAHRIALQARQMMRRERARLDALNGGLVHLNPLAILSRGYSITERLPEAVILIDAAEVSTGDMISTRLQRGTVLSRVEKTKD